MYLVTEQVDSLPTPLPITRDLDAGIYCKGDAGKLVLGGFEFNAKILDPLLPALEAPYALFDEDWQQFDPFITAGLKRFPALQQTGIRQFINGPESFTHDTQPLLGPVPGNTGLWVAAGMNSLGIVSAPGVGKSLAQWMLQGSPNWDLLAQDISRVDPVSVTQHYRELRMQEAVASQFDMHWPYKQPVTARGAKRTPCHSQLASQGAVFGSFSGWERPLWFAREDEAKQLNYSFGPQHWWSICEREATALTEHCGLIDLSAFSKIRLQGADALALLQLLTTRDMDTAVGRANYTLLLNQRAGIIADVTVTRLAEDDFLLVSAAAAHYKVLDWITQQAKGRQLQLWDASHREAVFAIAGPDSRKLLQLLCPQDISAEQFPFGAVRELELGLVRTRVARLSYSGELGFEIYCPVEYSAALYEQLCLTGEPLGLTPIGMLTLDACRLEKGFVHWGHDIGPADNPLEADLMHLVAMRKPCEFIGRQALVELQTAAPSRRRVVLVLESEQPQLLLHDEPVYWQGKCIGHTTSGARGARTGLHLSMAYLDLAEHASTQQPLAIDIAGHRVTARIAPQAVYDPSHSKLRS